MLRRKPENGREEPKVTDAATCTNDLSSSNEKLITSQALAGPIVANKASLQVRRKSRFLKSCRVKAVRPFVFPNVARSDAVKSIAPLPNCLT
jgi:hypothetical protein